MRSAPALGASTESTSGAGGVMPGGGGGGSGGGGGTCAAAASMLNIRAHSLHDTVLPGRHPPGSGLMCPQCMQAIVSRDPSAGAVATAPDEDPGPAAAAFAAPGLSALVLERDLRTFGTPSLSARRGFG